MLILNNFFQKIYIYKRTSRFYVELKEHKITAKDEHKYHERSQWADDQFFPCMEHGLGVVSVHEKDDEVYRHLPGIDGLTGKMQGL